MTATWAVGAGDDTYAGAHGLAVDPTGTYVAVACLGLSLVSGGYINGSTTIFYATNGAVVTNVDLGLSIPSKRTTNSVPPLDPTQHTDTDCDWDAVGNLYYLDAWPGVWRAVSPPGTNQATTVALPIVQVTSSAQDACYYERRCLQRNGYHPLYGGIERYRFGVHAAQRRLPPTALIHLRLEP